MCCSSLCGRVEEGKRKQDGKDKEKVKGERERKRMVGREEKGGRKAIKDSIINSVRAGPQGSQGGGDHLVADCFGH